MEPNILLIGRNISTLEILKDELIKFNRSIVYANSKDQITTHLRNEKIDLIVVGAGLPREEKQDLLAVIEKTAPEMNCILWKEHLVLHQVL